MDPKNLARVRRELEAGHILNPKVVTELKKLSDAYKTQRVAYGTKVKELEGVPQIQDEGSTEFKKLGYFESQRYNFSKKQREVNELLKIASGKKSVQPKPQEKAKGKPLPKVDGDKVFIHKSGG